jgi:putative membrane protein
MTVWLDAALAYLHFIAIFALFGFLTAEAMLIRATLDANGIRLLGRIDLWYFGAAMVVLVTGFLRLGLGAKGADFYLASWPIYVKIGLFLLVAIVSIYPTMAFMRWRRMLERDPAWRPEEGERIRYRKLVMAEVHLVALIPVFAVIMARGLGRG